MTKYKVGDAIRTTRYSRILPVHSIPKYLDKNKYGIILFEHDNINNIRIPVFIFGIGERWIDKSAIERIG